MDQVEEFELELNTFTHDLFLENGYLEWRKNLKNNEPCKWHSLIASLDKYGAPLEKIKNFGEQNYSKLVFSYIEAPDYQSSKMLMVQFTISESMWNSLVWHCPERN